MSVAKYRCAQDVFYILSRAGWRLCRKNRAAFAIHKGKYTDEYIDEHLAAIDEVDFLPDFNGRYVNYDLTKIAMDKCRDEYLFNYEILLTYFKDAYAPEVLDTMLRGVGADLLKDAKKGVSAKTTKLMSATFPFLTDHAAELEVSVKKPTVKDNMPADFPEKLNALKSLFKTLNDDLQVAEENGKEQTVEKVDLNNVLYFDLMDMLDDAARFFADDAALVEEFTYGSLKKKAQSTKQAGIKGRILDETGKKAIPKAKITIMGTTKECIADAKGRYNFSQMSAETVQLVIEAEGYETMVIKGVKIKTGIVSRFNIKLVALAVAVAA